MINKKIFLFIIIFILLSNCMVYAASFTTMGLRFNKKVKTLKELKQNNIVSQGLDISCGAASLCTLLKYYLNVNITEKEIITHLLRITPLEKVKARRGFSLYDLKTFAIKKGYKVEGYKMDMEFLRNLGKPVLVPIQFKNYRHFVVVKKIAGDRVFIADPAAGNVSLKLTHFLRSWIDGIGLLIESNKNNHDNNYALKVKKKDLLFADYKKIQQIINPLVIQTTIRTNEW